MHNKFTQLNSEDDVILLEDTLFNAIQIRNKIIGDFEPRGNDFNFAGNNSFIKKYFKQTNVHGIFNRVAWKCLLKKGIKCELLMPGNNGIRKGRLEIRIILEFFPARKQVASRIDGDIISNSLSSRESNSENFQIKVSLDFCPEESEVQKILISNKTKSALNQQPAENIPPRSPLPATY